MQDPRPPTLAGGGAGSGAGGGGGTSGGGQNASLPFEAGHAGRTHDHTELAGFKDGIAIAHGDESHDRPSTQQHNTLLQQQQQHVTLSIKCPSLADHKLAESSLVRVPATHSIGQIKRQIEQSWPGRPRADGMRMFKSGQLLTDDVHISALASSQSDENGGIIIHLVIRPGAWSEKPKSSPMLTEKPTLPRSRPSSPHTSSSGKRSESEHARTDGPPLSYALDSPSVSIPGLDTAPTASSTPSQDRYLASMVNNMQPPQYTVFRDLISWLYASYVSQYREAWMQSYSSLVAGSAPNSSAPTYEALANKMGCDVDYTKELVENVESNVLLWGPLNDDVHDSSGQSPFTYKQIEIDGLPYLLRVERNVEEERMRALYRRAERLRNIQQQIDKLINYQSLLDRTLSVSPPPLSRYANLTAPPAPGMVRAANASLMIDRSSLHRFALLQRSDVFSVLIASLFLAFKMCILVYILTRGASPTKFGIMTGMACVYVTLHAYKMIEQKVAIRRRALRRVMGQEHATRPNAAATRTPPSPHAPASAPAPTHTSSTGRAASPSASVTRSATAAASASGPSVAAQRSSNRHSEHQEPVQSVVHSPVAPFRYRNTSPLVFDYWLERLAYYNLSDEDLDIGLRPMPGVHRLHNNRSVLRANRLARLANDYVAVPLIVLLASLVPEIEQKRRRAIDARENMVRTTAQKLEDEQRRAREAVEKEQQNTSDKTTENVDGDTSNSSNNNDTRQVRPPALLQSAYAQRILRRTSQGRQIDIAQEMEAAAAAAENEEGGDNAMDQVDMGFL